MPCSCEHDRWRAPPTRETVLAYAHHQAAVSGLLEPVKSDGSTWMSVLRCRECGGIWVEDHLSSGHADLSFVYAIETSDPERWLAAARPLF